ncbi:MAG: acetolactate synthase small subunit [Pelagibacteraceae bacterium]|jgi:acetolactate synthase I/III small subunit|nr:acetolactate synthase small subunit [Pelagibacteraceae bacterium]MCI5078894.1 acetolactate synthase small subunit [Pelagibacteraceae bacterium]
MSKSAYEIDDHHDSVERYVVVAWVDNEAGVLARVSGLFSGRGYNIESLAVSEVDHERKISRITIATNGTKEVIKQIQAQVLKLVPVHKVNIYPINKETIFRELALIKFLGEGDTLQKAEQLCVDNKFEFLDKTSKSFIVQALGLRTEIDEFIKKIKALGQVSISRTGALAMKKGSETVKDNKGQVL